LLLDWGNPSFEPKLASFSYKTGIVKSVKT
jgi:hypothetical protein